MNTTEGPKISREELVTMISFRGKRNNILSFVSSTIQWISNVVDQVKGIFVGYIRNPSWNIVLGLFIKPGIYRRGGVRLRDIHVGPENVFEVA